MWRQLGEAFINFCFPHSCFHCQSTQLASEHLLCYACSLLLEPLDKENRCSSCFHPNQENFPCIRCSSCKPPFLALASVFEYTGPAASLVKQLKYAKNTFLAPSMGAYLAAQLIRLEWPIPDCIVPVPMSAAHQLARGFNQSQLLSQSIASILQKFSIDALGRYSGDYSQAGLSKEQRAMMNKKKIILTKPKAVEDKTILLVDDVATTGQTLRCCAEILQQGKPKAIYALTFCMTR